MFCCKIRVRVHKQYKEDNKPFEAVSAKKWHAVTIFWHENFGDLRKEVNNTSRHIGLDESYFRVRNNLHRKLREQIPDFLWNDSFEKNSEISLCDQYGRPQTGKFFQYEVIETLSYVKSKYFFVRQYPRQKVYRLSAPKYQKFGLLSSTKHDYRYLHQFDGECDNSSEDKSSEYSIFDDYKNEYGDKKTKKRIHFKRLEQSLTELTNDLKKCYYYTPKYNKKIFGVPVHVGGDMLVRQTGVKLHYIHLPQPKFVKGKWVYSSLDDSIANDFGFSSFFGHQRAIEIGLTLHSLFPPYVLLEICSYLPWFKFKEETEVLRIFIAIQKFLSNKHL